MKLLKLSNKKIFTEVDDEVFEYLNQFKWFLSTRGYVCRNKRKDSEYTRIHRLIMNAPKGLEVDHIDNNPLNNQKSNLRICTHQENQRNQKKSKNRSSKFKGVSFNKLTKKWESYIAHNNKFIHLGHYENEIDAAKAHDKSARELHKEYATLNFE